MKHIGIAAVTAEGASITYRRICARAMTQLGDHRHPEITLHSHSLSEHLHVGQDAKAKWARLLLTSAEKLKAAGADFMICPSNTPHAAYDELAPKLPLPWIHIAQATCDSVKDKAFRTLLLLGTRFTIESTTIYDPYCVRLGIELVRPNAADTVHMHDLITQELVFGRVTPHALEFFKRITDQAADAGIDGAILGCTELPLVIQPGTCKLAVVDSTVALADAAVRLAIAGSAT